MTSMPSTTDPVTDLPSLLGGRYSHYFANSFVAWNDGEAVSECSVLDSFVGVADTAGEDFGKNLNTLVDRMVGYSLE